MARRTTIGALVASLFAALLLVGAGASAQQNSCPYLYTECPVLFSKATGGFPTTQFSLGETFVLEGEQFPPGSEYTLVLDQNPTATLVVGGPSAGPGGAIIEIDADGDFAVASRIPTTEGFRNGPARLIMAADAAGDPVATLGITITDNPTRPQAAGGDGGTNGGTNNGTNGGAAGGDGQASLPNSGADAAVLGSYGALLLGGGTAMIVTTRRRRRSS